MNDNDINDEETCPNCGGDTDPAWFCGDGYCPTCCEELDEVAS